MTEFPLGAPHSASSEAVLAAAQTDSERGLLNAEASERQQRVGPNQLAEAPPEPLWRKMIGYVPLNTRDREVSVVEDAERLLQAEKRRSDELIASGRHAEATLVLPSGYYWKWSGQFENQQRATKRLSIVVPLVLLTMFILIYMGLGRWWLGLIVFVGIIVSASGGFLMLYLWGVNLSVAVWVGFIALFGIVDNDSVIILTYLEDIFRDRQPESVGEIREMVLEGGLKRVRPCLMATATTVIGLIPIFMAHGRGSDIMQPMAIPAVGGMAIQLITVSIAPCLYSLVQEWKLRRKLRILAGSQDPAITSVQ